MAAWSPGGEIATADAAGTLRLWTADGRQRASIADGARRRQRHRVHQATARSSPSRGPTAPSPSRTSAPGSCAPRGAPIPAASTGSPSIRRARAVVTANQSGTAVVWSIEGRPLVRLEGHTDSIWQAVFDPTGERVITASLDKTARVWDARTGATLHRLVGPRGSRAERRRRRGRAVDRHREHRHDGADLEPADRRAPRHAARAHRPGERRRLHARRSARQRLERRHRPRVGRGPRRPDRRVPPRWLPPGRRRRARHPAGGDGELVGDRQALGSAAPVAAADVRRSRRGHRAGRHQFLGPPSRPAGWPVSASAGSPSGSSAPRAGGRGARRTSSPARYRATGSSRPRSTSEASSTCSTRKASPCARSASPGRPA